MPREHPALTPYPMRVLLGRIAAEWETRHRVFDMPTGRFFHTEAGLDLSVPVYGTTASTPLGPAAGPHTQLAANYVLGWLAGARVFEMKTVQVLDELEIERPCIDMEAVGYNVEWSQELTLPESLTEYVTAWMMLEILRRWEPLRPSLGEPGDHVFDMSVGYDLEGIQSPTMDRFIRGVLDATEVIDSLRPQIAEPFTEFREHDFRTQLVESATLSTFHGCPPEEIEAIARHLMSAYGLDVTVKLNPTLLGFDETRRILVDRLGHDHLQLFEDDFAADLQFNDAVAMFGRLESYARELGRTFGIKLTNTLVVGNHRSVLPGEKMYLSGEPLHVLAVTLLDRLVAEMPSMFRLTTNPGSIPVSWSAGIDRTNVAHAVGLGLAPVTICTNLLKPGGYGHLSTMLGTLAKELHASGYTDVPGWIEHTEYSAEAEGYRDAVEAYADRLTRPDEVRAYTRVGTTKRLREVDRALEVWDCVSCNLCVTVCPNDAMVHLRTPESLQDDLTERWQYVCLAELCNDCGNCVTFCPEEGKPFEIKPRLFIDPDRFAAATGQAYLVSSANGDLAVHAAPGCEADLENLEKLINGDEGLPLRPRDLSFL